jgi:hypothetical protein
MRPVAGVVVAMTMTCQEVEGMTLWVICDTERIVSVLMRGFVEKSRVAKVDMPGSRVLLNCWQAGRERSFSKLLDEATAQKQRHALGIT